MENELTIISENLKSFAIALGSISTIMTIVFAFLTKWLVQPKLNALEKSLTKIITKLKESMMQDVKNMMDRLESNVQKRADEKYITLLEANDKFTRNEVADENRDREIKELKANLKELQQKFENMRNNKK